VNLSRYAINEPSLSSLHNIVPLLAQSLCLLFYATGVFWIMFAFCFHRAPPRSKPFFTFFVYLLGWGEETQAKLPQQGGQACIALFSLASFSRICAMVITLPYVLFSSLRQPAKQVRAYDRRIVLPPSPLAYLFWRSYESSDCSRQLFFAHAIRQATGANQLLKSV
jgi:hypothetical protein